jgi:hypothetical protein
MGLAALRAAIRALFSNPTWTVCRADGKPLAGARHCKSRRAAIHAAEAFTGKDWDWLSQNGYTCQADLAT